MCMSPKPILVFWLFFLLLRTSIGIMAFFSTVEAINLREVYFLFFWGGVDTRHGWVLALSPSTSRASVVVLFWVGGENLLSRKWLFPTRYVNKGGVGRLIFSTKVLLLLFCGSVPLGTPWVHVAGTEGGLQQNFASALTAFLTASSQEFRSLLWASN